MQQTYNTITSAEKHISVILENEVEWPLFDGVDLGAVQRQAATTIASLLFNDVERPGFTLRQPPTGKMT